MQLASLTAPQRLELARAFRFGLEAEFLLADRETFQPLWYRDLPFPRLKEIFEGISLDGIPSLEGLELEPPMTKLMPFVVEGYHLPDMDAEARDMLPKGVEIRTPVCSSLPELLAVYRTLHQRLAVALEREGYAMVALSHHPLETTFSGPQSKRRHDLWQWAMEVMTTYGPDVNVSLAPELAANLDFSGLEAKVNFYAPALSALSVAAPFCNGEPWEMRGKAGKSFRMHKRSYIAPPIKFHPQERHRLELKVFDMPKSLREFEAQFLGFLALLLDEGLRGRASAQTRIYDLGQVARFGLGAESVKERAAELLARAPGVLESWGFDPAALQVFRDRLETGITPADEMLAQFRRTGSLAAVLRDRWQFQF